MAVVRKPVSRKAQAASCLARSASTVRAVLDSGAANTAAALDIDAFMAATGPATHLLFDAGHCTFGGGDPAAVLARHASRVAHFHAKNIRPAVTARVRAEGLRLRCAATSRATCDLAGQLGLRIEELERDVGVALGHAPCLADRLSLRVSNTLSLRGLGELLLPLRDRLHHGVTSARASL